MLIIITNWRVPEYSDQLAFVVVWLGFHNSTADAQKFNKHTILMSLRKDLKIKITNEIHCYY